MSNAKRGGCLRTIFGLLFVGVAVVYGVAALTSPWSFHIALATWILFLPLRAQFATELNYETVP
jgi:hypothetical protein